MITEFFKNKFEIWNNFKERNKNNGPDITTTLL